jgi:effector-binding domain-containing protein
MATAEEPTPAVVDVDAQHTAVIRGLVPAQEIAAFFDRVFTTLPGAIAADGAGIAGPAFALYRSFGPEGADIDAGFPVTAPIEGEGDVIASETPAGRVARVVHAGAYDDLGGSWERLRGWITDQGLTPASTFWEVYVTQPTPDMDPAELRTELNWLLAP